jgi:hypothetical protein
MPAGPGRQVRNGRLGGHSVCGSCCTPRSCGVVAPPRTPDLGHAQRMVAAANQHRAVHANPLGPHLLASARRPRTASGKNNATGYPRHRACNYQLHSGFVAAAAQPGVLDRRFADGAPRQVLRNRHIGDDGARSRDQVGLVRPGRGSRQPAHCSRSPPPTPLRAPLGLGQEAGVQQLRRTRGVSARIGHQVQDGVADVGGLHPRNGQQVGALE